MQKFLVACIGNMSHDHQEEWSMKGICACALEEKDCSPVTDPPRLHCAGCNQEFCQFCIADPKCHPCITWLPGEEPEDWP